ncbi:MAG TPA: hypothetical protein VLA29_09615 [Acidimicrobiia bacterium]|nr:hypothetical protein [Acidimicrobiia bacterium]
MRLAIDARTAAFSGLIDYAGVFPPASLSMSDAVAGYRATIASDDRWIVGRFLVRASQLQELAAVATHSLVAGDQPWNIGVVCDTSPGAGASLGLDFQREMSPAMTIAAFELMLAPGDAPGNLIDTVATIDPDLAVFIEVDREGPLDDQVRAIGDALRDRGRRGGAKLRCGGLTKDDFPTVDEVTEFVWAASFADVPFKATAGLHQPIRHRDAAIGAWRHGFVNLLIASVAADAGQPISVVREIVAESDPTAFAITPVAASWRDVVLPGSAIRRSRLRGLVAFGSCDIDEPREALAGMSFLGDGG